jgi:hypothetical protein
MARLDVESWEQLLDEELAADMVEDVAVEDFGIVYEDWEELMFGEESEFERDRHRWELDPASAEDFIERTRGVKVGPALRWRHFGH